MVNCSKCDKPAVAHLRYFSRRLCKNHFVHLFESRARKQITKYQLIKAHDIVGVAVSGGKDSIGLLRFLHKLRTPKTLVGITIDEGSKGYRDQAIPLIKETYEELGIDYQILTFKKEFGKSIDQIAKKSKFSACYHCGVLRRRLINEAAKRMGCNSVATGHNLDDECQAVMMNYIRGDFARMARMSPEPKVHPGFVKRIKPFREIPEKEVALYTLLKEYPYYDVKKCPYASDSLRNKVKSVIYDLENDYPGTRFCLIKGADDITPMLKKRYSGAKMIECKECGEPSVSGLCNVCKVMKLV
jgi:uncharacterized protein (TIGR00269 family)